MPEESNTPEHVEDRSGLRDVLALVANGPAPLQVGDIELDEDGRIRRRSGDQPLRLVFAYRGADFEARIETAPEAHIALSAELGKVPYSMEQGDSRRVTQRIIEATADLPSGRIEVSKAQDMSLVATAQPPLPLTPASVMAAITSLLLDFGPYIDLLRETIAAAERACVAVAAAPSSPPEQQPESS